MFSDTFPIYQLPPEQFPDLLSEIPGKPKQLFVRGTLPAWDEYKFLCVVGSRAATSYGTRACQMLVGGLAGAPVVIVSGLALGLDATAHRAALLAKLPTIAVLPSGVVEEAIFPATNRRLAQEILQAHGALISEFEAREYAGIWTFPSRNRIMAGISHATLIIEAGEESGTLITARLALDFNRDVLCVPHPIDSEKGRGSNRLIREGATLVGHSSDILQALGLLKENASNGFSRKELPTDLSEAERKICQLLLEPLTRDEILEAIGIKTQDANIALSTLLIRGIIIERLGKIERI